MIQIGGIFPFSVFSGAEFDGIHGKKGVSWCCSGEAGSIIEDDIIFAAVYLDFYNPLCYTLHCIVV